MCEKELSQQPGVVHYVQHGILRIELHSCLAVIADFQGLSPFNGSRQKPIRSIHIFRIVFTGQEIYESSLPGTIPTDDSDLFVTLEIVGKIVKVAVFPVPETHILAIDDFGSEARRAGYLRKGNLF